MYNCTAVLNKQCITIKMNITSWLPCVGRQCRCQYQHVDTSYNQLLIISVQTVHSVFRIVFRFIMVQFLYFPPSLFSSVLSGKWSHYTVSPCRLVSCCCIIFTGLTMRILSACLSICQTFNGNILPLYICVCRRRLTSLKDVSGTEANVNSFYVRHIKSL